MAADVANHMKRRMAEQARKDAEEEEAEGEDSGMNIHLAFMSPKLVLNFNEPVDRNKVMDLFRVRSEHFWVIVTLKVCPTWI